jgi:hypothetical protein
MVPMDCTCAIPPIADNVPEQRKHARRNLIIGGVGSSCVETLGKASDVKIYGRGMSSAVSASGNSSHDLATNQHMLNCAMPANTNYTYAGGGAMGASCIGEKPNVAAAAPFRDDGRPKSDSPRGRPLGLPPMNGLILKA